MSAEGTTREGQRDERGGTHDEKSVEQRAEEIVQQVSEQAAQFAVRLLARAREDVEDILAKAQTIGRGGRPRE